MKKAITLLMAALTLAVTLTGCVRDDISVKLNKDGSGSISVSTGIEESFYETLKENGNDPFNGKETSTVKYDDSNYIVCKETTEYETYADIEKALGEMTYNTELFEGISDEAESISTDNHIFKSVNVDKKSGIFYSVYTFNAVLNPQEDEVQDTPFNDLFKVTVTVEMPGKISQSKGGEADENTIFFDINDLTEETELAAISESNNYGIVIGAIVVIVLAGAAFFIIAKKNA